MEREPDNVWRYNKGLRTHFLRPHTHLSLQSMQDGGGLCRWSLLVHGRAMREGTAGDLTAVRAAAVAALREYADELIAALEQPTTIGK